MMQFVLAGVLSAVMAYLLGSISFSICLPNSSATRTSAPWAAVMRERQMCSASVGQKRQHVHLFLILPRGRGRRFNWQTDFSRPLLRCGVGWCNVGV